MQATFPFLLCALCNAVIQVCRAGQGGLSTLQVTDVSENSAALHWEDSTSKLTKGQLKLVCTGSSVYTLLSGAEHVSYSTSTQAAPRDISRISLSDLHPNTNYTCVVIYEDHDVREVHSNSAHFCTYYSDPSPPPAPLVLLVPEKQLQNQSDNPVLLQLDLFPASTKHGPIHGYELQFCVVLPHEVKSGRINHPIQHQLGPPYGSQFSIQDATSTKEAMNFAYHLYKSDSLPTRVNISTQLVGGALKPDTTYSAVLLAYTNDTVHRQILLSYSPFSKFFFISENRAPGVTNQFKLVYREALTSIVFGSALPVLAVVGFVLLSVAIGWKLRKKRSRNCRKKQTLRPVFMWPHMRRSADQCGEDSKPLLDEASDTEEQLPSSNPAPSFTLATAYPSTQTSEPATVPHQEKTKATHAEDSPLDGAYLMAPVGSLRKGGGVEAPSGCGSKHREHVVNKHASKWLNKCRRKSKSVKYTKLACTPNSSDSEGGGTRESRPPVPKRRATQISDHSAMQTSTPAPGNAFPPLSSLSAAVHTLVEAGQASSIGEAQPKISNQAGKGDTSVELGKDALDLQDSAMVRLSSESAMAEGDVLTLSSSEKFDLLSRNQAEHVPFHPYCFINPVGPEQPWQEKADHEKDEDTTGCDYAYELARLYQQQFGGDSNTIEGESTMNHCEPHAEGISCAEVDLRDSASPNAHPLIAVNSPGECPQFSPANKETSLGPLESDSSLVFPQQSSLSSISGVVTASDPSLLNLPSRCESKEMEEINISTDSFTSKHPLAHSSNINLVHPSDHPSSPPLTSRPPNGASLARPHTPLSFAGVSPNLLQPKEEGLLLLLQGGVATATPADSTASFDLPTPPSDVDICSKMTLVGPSSSSDQIVHP